MRHPDLQTLASYCDNTLDQEKRLAVEKHLVQCDSCIDLVGTTIQLTPGEQPSENFVNSVLDRVNTQRKRRAVILPLGISAAALVIAGLLWLVVINTEPKSEPTNLVKKASTSDKPHTASVDELINDLAIEEKRDQAVTLLLTRWEDDNVNSRIENMLTNSKRDRFNSAAKKVYKGIMFRRLLGKEEIAKRGDDEIAKELENLSAQQWLEFLRKGIENVKVYKLDSEVSQTLFASLVSENLNNNESKERFVKLIKDNSLKSCAGIVEKFLNDPELKDIALDALAALDPNKYRKDALNLVEISQWHKKALDENKDALKDYDKLTAKIDHENFKDYVIKQLQKNKSTSKSTRRSYDNPLVTPRAFSKMPQSIKKLPLPDTKNSVSVLVDTEKRGDNQTQFFYAYIKKDSVRSYSLITKSTDKPESKPVKKEVKDGSGIKYITISFIHKNHEYILVSETLTESELLQISVSIK